MNILLLGSGGRESAFAWKIAQSKKCTHLYVAPGNAGTAQYGTNVDLNPLDFNAIGKFSHDHSIAMVVVGPEDPLVNGIHDYFLEETCLKGISIVGPQKAGARLEGSKNFAKKFMQKHKVPTAAFRSFQKQNLNEGLAYLENQKTPIVLKADGLAGGKGVSICQSVEEAKAELKAMLEDAKFGKASSTVLIEEYLNGIELSVFVLSDGKNYKVLPAAKDYKRVGEGDTGPNTGGMGSVSPAPFANQAFMQKVEERIIIPTLEGLKKEGIVYTGFLFIGLMNVQGDPYVIEYNVRMGDPETESILPRIETDMVDLLVALSQGSLDGINLKVSSQAAATVVLVAEGYPGNYKTGKVISGIENVRNSLVFHAGTKLKDGSLETSGGRVLAITSLQNTLFDALQNATADAGRVYFEGRNFRRDIGFDVI